MLNSSTTDSAAQQPPLLSPDWYRLAHLKPRLRAGVSVSRHVLRGQVWYLLTDPVSGAHHRFNDLAYRLLGACDGHTSIDAIWASNVTTLGDEAPTQGDAIGVFAQAFAANLFTGDVSPDVAALARSHSRTRARQRRARLNPLAFRVPLWNPDAFLQRHVGRVGLLLSKPALWAWALMLLGGALLLGFSTEALARHGQQALGSGRVLLLMWLCYPLMKLLHELGHAFAVKHFGGAVHEMGVTLMLLTPVPYVDASASVSFADKHQRMLVSGAGIAVEALLATLALPLFLLAEPGWLKDFSFTVVFIGAMSTLVVNGNPLLRFDGYHVLTDLLELPNLGLRSSRWWLTLFKRRLLALPRLRFGAVSAGETKWLAFYAPASLLYRWALMSLMVLATAQWSPSWGLALALLLGWQMLLRPLWAAVQWLRRSPELRGVRPKLMLRVSLGSVALLLAAVVVPLPQHSHASGLVWLPDDALARASSEGFVQALLVKDGQRVRAGMALAQLRNEVLELEWIQSLAELQRHEVERAQQFATSARRTRDAEEALVRLRISTDRLHQRVQALTVRAGVDGRVVIDPARVRLGQMLAQGEVVAQVLPPGPPLVRTLVSQQDIELLRERPGAIQVQLAQGGPARPALFEASQAGTDAGTSTLLHTGRASTALPSRALGQAGGGAIATDPTDSAGRTASEPHFQVDLRLGDDALDEHQAADAIGSRVLVRFSHGSSSAAEKLMRFLRLSFLRHFS